MPGGDHEQVTVPPEGDRDHVWLARRACSGKRGVAVSGKGSQDIGLALFSAPQISHPPRLTRTATVAGEPPVRRAASRLRCRRAARARPGHCRIGQVSAQAGGATIRQDSLDDAVATVRRLAARGCLATVDILGEHVTSPAQALETCTAYMEVLARLDVEDLPAGISVKRTALGLAVDRDFCLQNLDDLAE